MSPKELLRRYIALKRFEKDLVASNPGEVNFASLELPPEHEAFRRFLDDHRDEFPGGMPEEAQCPQETWDLAAQDRDFDASVYSAGPVYFLVDWKDRSTYKVSDGDEVEV